MLRYILALILVSFVTAAGAQPLTTKPSFTDMLTANCSATHMLLGGAVSPACGPTPTRAGDVMYFNGTTWVALAGNNSGTKILQEDASGIPSWASAGTTTITEAQGRLTLQTNTPVMTTSQSAKTTLLYDCFIGANVPYYNGSSDLIDTITACEVSDAMVSAASAGQVVNNNVYDVWWVHGGANRICLAMSTAVGGGGGWSADTAGSNTARGTGYSQLDLVTRPYPTNKNSISNCFNAATNYGPVSVNQGTYLGTVYASANGQISWTLGASGAGGTAGLLGVWNNYNRVNVGTRVQDSSASYTYTSATIRQARASAGNQVSYVAGRALDAVPVSYSSYVTTVAVAFATCTIGIGVDSTTAYVVSNSLVANSAAAAQGSLFAAGVVNPGVGLHVISANESSDGANANTFDQNPTTTGLFFSLMM